MKSKFKNELNKIVNKEIFITLPDHGMALSSMESRTILLMTWDIFAFKMTVLSLKNQKLYQLKFPQMILQINYLLLRLKIQNLNSG